MNYYIGNLFFLVVLKLIHANTNSPIKRRSPRREEPTRGNRGSPLNMESFDMFVGTYLYAYSTICLRIPLPYDEVILLFAEPNWIS